MYHRLVVASAFSGEVSEPAEGARLLSEYTGLNLYRGFKSLPLRHLDVEYQHVVHPPLRHDAGGLLPRAEWGRTKL